MLKLLILICLYSCDLCRGYVDTELNRTEGLLAVRKLWITDTPMQRLCDAEELVGGVLYLASSLSTYTTGHDLIMDGGFTCW